MTANITEIEKRLWDAADELRANSKLKSSEYSVPVLGLIFLRYADHKFMLAERELVETSRRDVSTRRRTVGKIDYQARGVLYLPDAARFARLLAQPEGANIGQVLNDAMRAVEAENEALRDVLPKTYTRLDNSTPRLAEELQFGADGHRGGRVRQDLRVLPGQVRHERGAEGRRVLHPHLHRQADRRDHRAVPGADLRPGVRVGRHVRAERPLRGGAPPQRHGGANGERAGRTLSIFGQEKVAETVRLCRMNLAVNGLEGDIDQGNSYYEDPHNARGKFDFVMANPPFNVDKVDKERLAEIPLPLRPAQDRQRQLPVDPAFLQQPERDRPRRLRDGELRGRCARLRAGDPPQADRGCRGGRDGRGRVEFLLHGDAAVYAVVLDRGKEALTPGPFRRGGEAGRRRALIRCSSWTPGTFSGRWTARTGSSPRSRSNSWRPSSASTAGKS